MDKLLLFPGKTDRGVFTYLIDHEHRFLEKTAAQYHPTIAAYINAAKPIPGKTQILQTALGAYEYWGFNVNGDAFPETSLAHEGEDYGYKTFERYAKIYKHHCFVKGTRVKTEDGLVPIEDVTVGTEVTTHEGRLRPVTHVFRNDYSGPGRKITVQGLGRPIICTAEHRFFVVSREELICPRHRNGGRNFCTFLRSSEPTCRICGRSKSEPQPRWLEAQDIRPGDYITQAIAPVRKDDDLAKVDWGVVLGFFLAEGCYSKKHGKRNGLQFTFGKEELGLIERLGSSLTRLGYRLTGPYFHEKNNTALVVATDCGLADKVHTWCGEYSDRKSVSPALLNFLGDRGARALLGSYIDGDGHVYKTGKNAGNVRVRSVSFALLEELRDWCLSLRLSASFNVDSPHSYTNGFGNTSAPSAVLGLTPSVAAALSEFSDKCKIAAATEPQKTGATSLLGESRWLHRVAGVEDVDLDTSVYNIEVSDDHSYQVHGLDVHNCNKDPTASYGDVALSVYNPIYHRVELIVVLDNAKAPDIVQRIENGEYPDVSMGCKVPYDVCSICGNKAPTRKQYCEHLKYYLGRIHPETGRAAYAINLHPKFFDISFVLIGADRIAKTLMKVAGAPQRSLPSSAWLAEKMAVEDKAATIEKEVPADEPPASQESLTDLVRGIMEVKAREPHLPTPLLNNLGRQPFKDVMSTLAMLGILPKPQEFQRLVLVNLGSGHIADELDRRGECFDPMSVDEPSEAHVNALGLSGEGFNPYIAEMLHPHLAQRSYAAPLLARRLMITIKQAEEVPLPTFIKVGAEEVAKERKPIGIIPMLALAAGLYAAFAKKAPPEAVRGIDKLLVNNPGLAAALGLGLYATFNSLAKPGAKGNYVDHPYVNPDANDVFSRIENAKQKPYVKVGALSMGPAAKRLLLGIPLAYMASGVLQKHKELNPYDEEGRVKRFARRNPDVVSGALIADAMLSARGRGTHGLIRKAAPLLSKAKDVIRHAGQAYFPKAAAALEESADLEHVKIASAQEFLSSSLIWPLAMGKANLPGRVVSGMFDQAAMDIGHKLYERGRSKKGHRSGEK